MHKFMKYSTYTVCVNTRSSALQYFERDSWLSRIYQGLLWFCPAQGAEFHPQSILLRDTSKEVRSGHPGVRGLTVGGMHSEQMRRKPEDNPPHGRHQHKPVSGTLCTVALLLPSLYHILWRSSRSNLTTTSSLLCINCRTNQYQLYLWLSLYCDIKQWSPLHSSSSPLPFLSAWSWRWQGWCTIKTAEGKT